MVDVDQRKMVIESRPTIVLIVEKMIAKSWLSRKVVEKLAVVNREGGRRLACDNC